MRRKESRQKERQPESKFRDSKLKERPPDWRQQVSNHRSSVKQETKLRLMLLNLRVRSKRLHRSPLNEKLLSYRPKL